MSYILGKKKKMFTHAHTDTMCFTAKHFTSITINKTEHKKSFHRLQNSARYSLQ